jgi:hypothetical protein
MNILSIATLTNCDVAADPKEAQLHAHWRGLLTN